MRMREALQQIRGKPLICPPKASTISISQASPPSPRFFGYRSNLKYFPLKAASLAEQLMLALLQQPYGTPKSNYFNNSATLTHIRVHFVPYQTDLDLNRKNY